MSTGTASSAGTRRARTSTANGPRPPTAGSSRSSTRRPRSRSARPQLAGPADIDRAVRAARAAFDTGPWAASAPAERAAVLSRAGGADLRARAGSSRGRSRSRSARRVPIAEWQPLAAKLYLDWHAAQASTFPWEEERDGHPQPAARAPAARRRGRRDRAVELPARAVVPEARARAADRLLRRAQAARGDAAVRLPAGGGVRGGRPAARRAQRRRPPTARSSEELVRHPLVDKISFTGSTRAGRRIAALCGEQIKRCSLELGGKSAAIVLPDADLDAVIAQLAPNTMRNNGQTCTNATRVLAHRERYDEVVEALREAIGALPDRRPGRPGRVRRPARQRRPARAGRGLHRHGPAGGSPARARRRPSRSRARVLRRADDLRRRRQPDDDRAGGDLRPGRLRDPVRRRG